MADRGEHGHAEAVWISRVIAEDDHDAFAELVRLHQSPVRQFLRRLTRNDWGRADDLAQDTFWKAYRNIGSYQARGRFLSWLFRIAYQLFITEERRRGGLTPVPLDDEMPGPNDTSEPFIARRTFEQLMDTLRPEERAAVVLQYRHELTHPEIAETLDLPIGSVKTLIRRARLKLQEAHASMTR